MDASFGVKLPGLVPAYAPTLAGIPDLVAEFENLGFDDVMDGEHILFASEMEHPGGSGNFEHSRVEQQSDRSDTLVMFGAIAAKTTRIKMISGILLAAAHPPVVLARQAATLDVISNGRFILGVGSGWNTAEFEQLGIPPAERAARTEEAIRVCRELWSPGLSTFEGRWTRFEDVISEPAPVTAGGVPVWWGGNAANKSTARRVATLAEGWLSREAADYEELATAIESIHAACERYGRNPATVGIRASLTQTADWSVASSFDDLVDRAIAWATRLVGLGVTHFNVPLAYYGIELEMLGALLDALRKA